MVPKLFIHFILFLLIATVISLFKFSSAQAQIVTTNTFFMGGGFVSSPGFITQPVVIVPQRPALIIERRGSNDYLYQYDNVYGPEASAAGRMSRTVVNPQPQFYLRGF